MFPKGLGTALITPFKGNKEVDYEALGRLVELQIEGGVDYIVVLGTTGEAATMTAAEKREVEQFIIRQVAGRLPLVLGVGGNNTAAVCEQVKQVNTAAFCAILSVCPYYNKPNQEGLYQHFRAIAAVSPLPVILYNVPGRTGVNLLPETVLRLRQAYPEKIIAIKEASGNVEQIKHLIAILDKDFAVISGDDGLAVELLQAGAVGLISVASNAYPREFKQLVQNKDVEMQKRFASLIALLFKEGNPTGIKALLNLMGLIENELRLPLVSASEDLQVALRIATTART